MRRKRLHRWSKKLGQSWDRIRLLLGMSRRKPIIVQAYRGFGRRDYLFLSGRVLRDKYIFRGEQDGIWRNFNNTIKRFNSREINNARLLIQFAGEEFLLQSDPEGYFTLDTRLATPLPPPPQEPPFWQEVKVILLGIPRHDFIVESTAEVLIPGDNTSFGVISDIDDTILKTYVTSWLKWRTLYLTILKNAFSRQAFRMVGPFFQALRRGPQGKSYNPFFYVSNSPWNLYDLLKDFLDLNHLPRGPILLRDFGLPYEDRPKGYLGHKHEQIIRLLELYAELPFVLIGDSGEKDANIYRAVCKAFPGRIKAVYIRDVRSKKRAEKVRSILKSIENVPCLLVQSYEEAARHAIANDLLDAAVFKKLT
jgi:phosphatidate phosphatase APP1